MSERDYRRFFRLRRDRQQDRAKELEFHLEMRAREFETEGHTPAETGRTA